MLFLRDAAGFILRNLFEVTVVSVAWLVLQLPILTGPGATVAVYQFARQAVLQDEARLSDFWRGLRLYPVSYTHLRAHETVLDLVCRLLLEKKKKTDTHA